MAKSRLRPTSKRSRQSHSYVAPPAARTQRRRVADGPSSTGETVRYFDLNVEKVLDGWSISHAVRELIANALDEQVLSGTRPVDISRMNAGIWRIRDYGRGLCYGHLTQNESPEKRRRENEVIGRFGVGLKDALAVMDRKGVGITLRSKHGDISLVHQTKAGFPDVHTLHAALSPPSDDSMKGTEILISGVTDETMEEAKGFFLHFSDEEILETTKVGQILRKSKDGPSRIYVKGLVVAEEPNFAFNYNVTALTQTTRKALNRERTNVGRAAYGERVKAMLLAAASPAVGDVLASNLSRMSSGNSCEEVSNWADVGLRACQILNAARRVVFVTDQQRTSDKEMVDRAIEDGLEIVTVPATIAAKLATVKDIAGNPLRSLEQFARQWSASIEYRFVSDRDLAPNEREIYQLWKPIAALAGGLPAAFKELKISETMRPSIKEGMNPAGLWEESTGRIIVHRRELRSLEAFAGTLLHELTHARTGHEDVSRDFEEALTRLIGRLAAGALVLS